MKTEWISVADRIPNDEPDPHLVLVYIPEHSCSEAAMFVASRIGGSWVEWIDSGIGDYLSGVTHWCELPEPP